MRELPTGTVTLLFTDIEGSTRLLTRLGERYDEALAVHRDLLRAAFTAHQGVEFGTQGDALFVAFARAPQAVAAAVAAQRALAVYPWPEASPVPVRMGLHTGDPRRTDDDYVGIDVHRAARIAAAAHGGQILLSSSTADLTRAALPAGVTLRDLGEHGLKDIDTPEHLFQVVVPGLRDDFPPVRSQAPAGEPVMGPTTPLVGRTGELALLAERLAAAVAGQGSVVLLLGEPGIGKTRLLEELAMTARTQGVPVLWGRCYEGEGAPAYWPWVQVVRAYVSAHDAETLRRQMGPGAADIAQVVPEVRQALPDLPVPPPLEPEQARFRLFDSVARFLKNATAEQPLVIALDDLHWADKPSLLLLQFLARELGVTRLLLLGAYRDVELDRQHPLAETIASLRRERLHERIPLRGLAAEEVAALVRDAAGTELDDAGRRLAAALHAETEGNPFFVQEVLRHLEESGRVIVRDGRWVHVPEDIGALGLPEGVREVIGRRLSRLSDTCNRALGVAAVIGREFDLLTLGRAGRGSPAALPDDPDDLLEVLSEAEAARLIDEAPRAPGRYRFAHALIRETLYEELSTARRVRLHRRVGEALEQQYGAHPEPRLAELAHHFAEAAPGGDVDKAIAYARRAADHAAAQYAYEDAARLYEIALQLLDLTDQADEPQMCDILLALGEVQLAAGDTAGARSGAQRVIETGRRIGDADVVARAVVLDVRTGEDWVRPDEGQRRLIEETLARLQDDSPVKAELMAGLGRVYAYQPAYRQESAPLMHAAIAMARRLGDRRALAHVLALTFWSLPSDDERARAVVEEAARLAEHAGAGGLMLTASWGPILRLLTRGDLRALDDYTSAARSRLAELRSPVVDCWFELNRATRVMVDGRFDEAERVVAGLRTAVGRLRSGNLAAQLAEVRYCLDRERGRLAAMLPDVERAAEENRTVTARALLAFAYADLGRAVEARRAFDAFAADDFADARADLTWRSSLPLLAEVCARLGDTARAGTLYRLLEPARHLNATYGDLLFMGVIARHLGLLAATMGRWEDAERHFADALAMNERQGAPPWAAWTRHDWAAMLLARAASGDRARALALLDEALAAARMMGMVRLEQAAAALRVQVEALPHAPAAPAPAPALPGGLSEREAEVLRLIAAGKSNREVAAALVISLNTVLRHVTHILEKTGAANRTEAARYAVRHGLVERD
jgi:class 3 adenylate cyclase/DNA-binding CsgD family transcriptional regulator